MSWSPASRNAVQLAVGWTFIFVTAAALFIHFDAIRDALGVGLMAENLTEQRRRQASVSDTEGAVAAGDGRVEIRAGDDGHFHATARINGRPVDVMVDTGASIVALTWEDAQSVGVYVRDSDFKHKVSTANGVARVAVVTLDTVTIEDITVRGVRAAVAEPGRLSTTLLGMSFLSQLGRTEMSHGVLLLQQ